MAVGPVITLGLNYTPSLIVTLGYLSLAGAVTYPDPSTVLCGTTYGPTGSDYTGTLCIVLDVETGRLVKLLGPNVGISL